MLKKLFHIFLEFLGRAINKKIIYYSRNENNDLGKTAVKSAFGFWYVGNVLDYPDIAYGILNNGLVEKEETILTRKILSELLKEKKEIYFYDIGANTGYYGIMAAHLGEGKIKCYSFEPLKEYCDCLWESIRLNRFDDVTKVLNFALGNENGQKSLYLDGSGSSFSHEFVGSGDLSQKMVEVKRLDDVILSEKLALPDFIKIDVEGFELEVLKGGERIIKGALPVIFVEIAYSLKNLGRNFVNENYNQTMDFLNRLGYKILCLDDDKLIELGNTYKTEGVRMFLCLHPEKHDLFIKIKNE